MMLIHELTEFFIRLHQVRFDFFQCVPIHSWHLSSVESPRRDGRNWWAAR
jgi:hypothetical protein